MISNPVRPVCALCSTAIRCDVPAASAASLSWAGVVLERDRSGVRRLGRRWGARGDKFYDLGDQPLHVLDGVVPRARHKLEDAGMSFVPCISSRITLTELRDIPSAWQQFRKPHSVMHPLERLDEFVGDVASCVAMPACSCYQKSGIILSWNSNASTYKRRSARSRPPSGSSSSRASIAGCLALSRASYISKKPWSPALMP